MTSRWQARRHDQHSGGSASDAPIVKVGLATYQRGRILVVRKRGRPSFILPGGKPKPDETDAETLQREVAEELSCKIVHGSLRWVGQFEDDAADLPGERVLVRLYCGELSGEVSSASEIAEARWWDQVRDDPMLLAPSLRHQILPALAHGESLIRGTASPRRSDRG